MHETGQAAQRAVHSAQYPLRDRIVRDFVATAYPNASAALLFTKGKPTGSANRTLSVSTVNSSAMNQNQLPDSGLASPH